MAKTSITKALMKVLEEEHWMRKVLIGGLLSAIPILCFFAKGYLAMVLRATIRGQREEGLPSWLPGESFVLGAKAFFIWLLYHVVPGLFLWIAYMSHKTAAFETFLIIGVVLAIVATAVLPWGIAIWLSSGSVKSAFDGRKVVKVFGFFGEYLDVLVRCLLLLVLSAGSVFGCFFAALASAHLLGEVAGKYLTGPQEQSAKA